MISLCGMDFRSRNLHFTRKTAFHLLRKIRLEERKLVLIVCLSIGNLASITLYSITVDAGRSKIRKFGSIGEEIQMLRQRSIPGPDTYCIKEQTEPLRTYLDIQIPLVCTN